MNVSPVQDAAPLPATKEQQVEITLPSPWHGQAYVIGLSAVDDYGLVSPPSNLVVIPCDPALITRDTAPPASTSADGPATAERRATDAASSTGKLSVGARAGIACGVVAGLAAIGGMVAFFGFKRRPRGNAVHPDPFQAFPDRPDVPPNVPPARFVIDSLPKAQRELHAH